LIIEWAGCSGSGKSTLCEAVYKNLLSSGVDVRKPIEFFLGRSFTKIIPNESLHNVFLDFLVLPWSVFSIAKNRRFLQFCLKILNNGYFSFGRRTRLLRSILRKTGLLLFLNCFCNIKQPILFDEGTIHIAHLLFANGDRNNFSTNEVERFCELVPTPDLIVHIMSSESEIIERTLTRKNKPGIDHSPDSLKRFIVRAHKVFKHLNELNPWKNKTLTFVNPDTPSSINNDMALNITNQILSNLPSKK
jgi:thymidylate kinase